MQKLNTLIIGSGAAGLSAAVRLDSLNVRNIAIYTEGLKMGTSINTGSDKQTYYKLGMYGNEADSPFLMAQDLAKGGSMHGDIALVEAALSPRAFHNLANMGVAFPFDLHGQYIGYKTDHDPKRRATSCGPYTSRDMCNALINEVKRRNIPVFEKKNAVKLLTDSAKKRVIGAIFIDSETGEFEAVQAENIIFAVGGPGGLYETSVYPKVHTGAIGLALEAGAKSYNLAESQFGLASTKFRWNVSGSYMQVLPRFISSDENGNDEKEFLREYFDSTEAMYDAIFLKGYQWPFSISNLKGSSLIDIFCYIEKVERNRRIFLDYRTDPADLDFDKLNEETKSYLINSKALADTPFKRLVLLNNPAIELYRHHQIDIEKEPLEIAVSAQHNNGGLAGNIYYESINLQHLFPIGEVNGSHGVTRPGGSALNAGQVGAFRASEFIANAYNNSTFSDEDFSVIADKELNNLKLLQQVAANSDYRQERTELQHRMSEAAAFIRSTEKVEKALDGAYKQLNRLFSDGLGNLSPRELTETLRNRQLCVAHIFYLEAILMQIDYIGSRGGALVLTKDGEKIHDKLGDEWRIKTENPDYRKTIMTCGYSENNFVEINWEACREIPLNDGWFETVWSEFRDKKIYGGK